MPTKCRGTKGPTAGATGLWGILTYGCTHLPSQMCQSSPGFNIGGFPLKQVSDVAKVLNV